MFKYLGELVIPISLKDIYTSIRLWLENNIINFDNNHDISQITDNIYIGNLSTGTNIELLRDNGITHVVTVMSKFNPPYPEMFDYHFVPSYNWKLYPIITKFKKSNAFIKNAVDNGGKVYIHCLDGISESVAITMAYFISIKNNNVKNIFEEIKLKRKIACPNNGFINQLEKYRRDVWIKNI